MKRKILWVLVNGLFCTFLFFGLIKGIDGATRVFVFWTWVNLFLSFSFLTDTVLKTLKEKGRAVPIWIDLPYDIVIIGILVWFGAIWTSVAYTIHFFLYHGAHEYTKEMEDKNE